MEHVVSESVGQPRLMSALTMLFGAMAGLLAMVGVYGVMAYMVTRRSREIGIRMALGAGTGSVVWLVMREVLVLVAAGIGIGLPAAIGLTRLVQAQLYGIAPTDRLSIAAATLLLAVVALLAGYLPARRASRYDPVRVLRYE